MELKRVEAKHVRTTLRITLLFYCSIFSYSRAALHPFYVPAREAFVPAREQQVGDQLVSHDGQLLRIDAIHSTLQIATVYNLRVADYHTYIVGCDEWGFSVWAHNINCAGQDYVTQRLLEQPGWTEPRRQSLNQALRNAEAKHVKNNPNATLAERQLAVDQAFIDFMRNNRGVGTVGEAQAQLTIVKEPIAADVAHIHQMALSQAKIAKLVRDLKPNYAHLDAPEFVQYANDASFPSKMVALAAKANKERNISLVPLCDVSGVPLQPHARPTRGAILRPDMIVGDRMTPHLGKPNHGLTRFDNLALIATGLNWKKNGR